MALIGFSGGPPSVTFGYWQINVMTSRCLLVTSVVLPCFFGHVDLIVLTSGLLTGQRHSAPGAWHFVWKSRALSTWCQSHTGHRYLLTSKSQYQSQPC